MAFKKFHGYLLSVTLKKLSLVTMSTKEETQIPLKILVDKARNKVLFAEADYNFVDILFSFLTLPMGTIIRLTGERSDSKLSIGSFNSLYKGLADLPVECFWTEECKAVLLNPINSLDEHCSKLKLNVEDTLPTKYFRCYRDYCGVTSICSSAKCHCGQLFSRGIERGSYSNSSRKEGIFVTETSSFIVTDDLHVKPNLIGSSIQMLIDMGVTDMANIEEKTIIIGPQQVLNLLRTALFSTHPLTNLFLQKAQSTHELIRRQPSSTDLPILSTETSGRAGYYPKTFNAKAFVRNSNREFLFVQAGGDFIDFLFSFITMPLGVVEWLLSGTTNISPIIDNLYNSVSSLNVGQYMKSKSHKDMLLHPPLPKQYLTSNHIFTLDESKGLIYFYDKPLTLKDPKHEKEFLKETAMFIVTDDLIATPLSSFSILAHLNNMKIPLNDIMEYDVSISAEEALEILKASLTSSEALSQGLKHQLLKKPKTQTY